MNLAQNLMFAPNLAKNPNINLKMPYKEFKNPVIFLQKGSILKKNVHKIVTFEKIDFQKKNFFNFV